MTPLILTLSLLLGQQTPQQILDQIGALLKQLSVALGQPTAVTPATGAELTAALKVGGTIQLKAGTTYAGNFVIAKPTTLLGGDPLTTVLAPLDTLSPVLRVEADDVTVRDLQIAPVAPDREWVVVGSSSATSADVQPHRVKLVNLTLRALNGGHRGIALHGSDLTVDQCHILGFWEAGRDSQGIWANNGPGPYTITNNEVEASGENILFGGDDPGIVGVVPSDIVISGNTFRKPETFRALSGSSVKNNVELKNAKRVRIINNVIDGWWHAGQDAPVQFTVRNQGGRCTWCVVDDVVFQGNLVRTSPEGFAVNILGRDSPNVSAQTQTITIDHNLFQHSTKGVQVIDGVVGRLTITNNTFPGITDRMLSLARGGNAKVLTPLVFTRNVLKTGSYGITGDGSTSVGLASLTAYATVQDFTGNVIEMTPERTIALPPGNTILAPGALAALLHPTTFKLLSGTAGY